MLVCRICSFYEKGPTFEKKKKPLPGTQQGRAQNLGHPEDTRRLDLVVPGLNVHRGLPLFCDITVISPLTRNGQPRGGTSNRGGSLLEQAERDNNATYNEVVTSGLGELLCLGSGVFGRWSPQCIKLVPARNRSVAVRRYGG